MALGRKKVSTPSDPSPPPRGNKGGARLLPSKNKSNRFVLLIGDEGAILVYMEGNKVVRRLFAPTPQPSSTEAMVGLMQSNPKVPLWILVDSLDQQFVRQTFPPVSSLSIKSLVQRRLDRDFQTEDLKGFLSLGREKVGRKEWHYLLIALVKTSLLTSWIDLVSELPNEFKGIYVVPVEASNYISILNRALKNSDTKSWQLLVTHNKVSGFRQVVTKDGKLIFTRVNQVLDDAIPAVIAGNIEQEIINTIEYLRRLDFSDNSGLDIQVVASQDVIDTLDLQRFPYGTNRALTPLDVADALGMEQAALSADRFGDVVMASAFLRTKKHILRFSTAYTDKLAKLYTARKSLKIVCGLITLLFIGLTGNNLFTMYQNQQETDENITKRSATQLQIEALKKKIDGLDKNVALKSVVVSTYDAYIKDAQNPIDFSTKFSKLLTAEQRLQTFDWTIMPPKGSTAAPANASGGANGAATIRAEMLFSGTYPDVQALSTSEEAFLTKLTTELPDYQVSHEPFPWATVSDKGVEITFDDTQKGGALKEGANRLTVIFSGPKKLPKSSATPTEPAATP